MDKLPADTSLEREDAGLDQRLARLGAQQRALLEQRLRVGSVNGHRLVARTLANLGVTHVYGVPGQPVYDTFGACATQGLRLIGTHHQQPAALMAAAHNYFAGRQTAATITSAGAPTANALSAVVVARDNGWPLVVLAGAAPLVASDAGYFMSPDANEIFRPIAKWVARVPQTRDIPACVAKAFETAITGRPGPVILELREDVLIGAATGCDSPPPSSPPEAIEINASMLQQAAAVLVAARRPLLIVGADLRWSAPFAELLELVDSLAVPFITSPLAGGAIADDHSLCMNAIPWVVQSQAEVVLVLGTRLDWNFRYGQLIAADATVIQIAIEEHPFVRHREIQIGAQADPGVFLRALLRQINPAERARARSHRDDSWIATLREASSAIQARRIAKASIDGDLISPLALAAQIGGALPRDAISIFDSNLVLAACQRMIPARLPVSRLTPGTSGCLGTGIAYAIAAKLAHPQRPVVAVCGDFAFGLGVMELETAVRHGVPIVVIVANNDGNAGSLRQKMHLGNHPERVAMFQRGLRYDKLMETFGGYAEHVEHPGGIGPALERALASARAACINVVIDSDAPVPSD